MKDFSPAARNDNCDTVSPRGGGGLNFEPPRRGPEVFMWKGFKVIDADAHMHEPQYLWERYVEPKFRDQVPKVAFMDGNFMVYEPDGKFIPKSEVQSAHVESARRAFEEKYGEAYRQWWSPQIRLR